MPYNPFRGTRLTFDEAEPVLEISRGPNPGGWYVAHCPVPDHDDQNPSLGVKEGDDGELVVFCHGGCRFGQVMDAVRELLNE